jgi:hypothetical protein
MVRDILVALSILVILAVVLLHGVSGLPYILLVVAAGSLSLLLVRRGPPVERRPPGGAAREGAAARAARRPSDAGRASTTNRYGAAPIQSKG